MLSRDDILAAPDLATDQVKVEAWGGEVRIRELSAAEMEEFSAWQETLKADGKSARILSMAGLLVFCIVDQDGNRLFTLDDAPKLAGKNTKALTTVFAAACRLNGMGRKAEADIAGK
jgi:hypothetical protein